MPDLVRLFSAVKTQPNPCNTASPEILLHSDWQNSQGFDDVSNLEYEDEIDSLGKLVSIVSESVIRTFGGFDRFHTLRVIGGSIVVNNCYYRCNIKL